MRQEVSAVVTPFLSKEARAQGRGKYLPTGLVNYKALARYLRLLEVDLAMRGKPMTQKLQRLEESYAKDQKRLEKQTATIKAKAGSRKRVRKFRGGYVKAGSVRDGYLWLKKARRIAGNVAGGSFPGRAYYRSR